MRRLILIILIVISFSNIALAGLGGYLKADTAVDLMVGPFVDDTDGKTAETGLTITQAEVRLSKNGANIAQKNEATALSHDELGNYVCKLDATDTNTEGILYLMIHESGALPIKIEYMIVNANVYDSLFAAATTDYLQVDTIQVTGTSQTANDMSGDIDDILTDTGTTLDTLIKDIPTVAEFEARTLVAADYVVVGDTIAGATTVTTLTGHTAQTGDSFAIVNGAAGLVAIDTVVDAILVDTGTTLENRLIAIEADTSELQTDDYPTSIAALQTDLDTLTAGVNVTSVAADAIEAGDFKTNAIDADALATDFVTEIWAIAMSDMDAAAPSVNAAANIALNWLYSAWRNGYKTDGTNSEIVLYKDDGTTPLVESTIADDGTDFTREEMRAPD